MLNPTLIRVVDEPVNEYGIIPALIAAGAAVAPAVMGSQAAKKDQSAQKRAILAEQKMLKQQKEKDKKALLYWSLGGVGLLVVAGTVIYVATRKSGRKR